MSAIADKLQAVRQRIIAAARAAGRAPESVRLLVKPSRWRRLKPPSVPGKPILLKTTFRKEWRNASHSNPMAF
jgi:hypothetical protein